MKRAAQGQLYTTFISNFPPQHRRKNVIRHAERQRLGGDELYAATRSLQPQDFSHVACMSLSTLYATSDQGKPSLLLFPRPPADYDHRQHQASSVTAAAIMPHFILWKTQPRTLFVRNGWTRKPKLRSSNLQSVRARSAKCLPRTLSMKTIASWYLTSLTSLRPVLQPELAEARKPGLREAELNAVARQ